MAKSYRSFWRARPRRRGTVLILAAILLVGLMALAALAVEVGVIAAARAQLRTVADAAALAGARELATERRMSATITNLTPEIAAARAKALEIGRANTVRNAPAQLADADVVIGYKKTTGVGLDAVDAAVSTSGATTLFNSVQVTARCTVPALFSGALGRTGSQVSVTSTATVDLFKIAGYRKDPSASAGILPIVLSLANYNAMMNGTSGDAYTFTPGNYNPPSTYGATAGADGVKESVIYPVTTGNEGNWGTINFGVSSNSTSTLGQQITSGITPAQMAFEYPNSQVVVPHTFSGDPGISEGIKDNLASIVGKSVTAPIYSQTGGNGNNAWYTVTAFASVRILAVNFQGKTKYVVVQPALNFDPLAIPDTGNPSPWPNGGVVVVHLSR